MKRLLLILISLTLAAGMQARQYQAVIIQTKMDRIYFSSGIEAGIAENALFEIKKEDSTIINGTIEFSGPGISYSHPITGLDSLTVTADYIALITVARADTAALITVGTDLPLDYFDPEHETLFLRDPTLITGIINNLVDSTDQSGNRLTLYLPRNVYFSDGSRFDAAELAIFLENLAIYSQSYVVRYFFSRMLPPREGGIVVLDNFTMRLEFYHPFPYAMHYLSHPDFSVKNMRGYGTGALVSLAAANEMKSFLPNTYYRGEKPQFTRLTVRYYDQSYQMSFAFEHNQIDGYFGFGFDSDLAGKFESRAQFPRTAVMIPGIGNRAFSDALFPTALYYCFDSDVPHLYFPRGEVAPVFRWLVYRDESKNKRFYPADNSRGRKLFGTIPGKIEKAKFVHDVPLLYETSHYLGDIIARENISTNSERYRYAYGAPPDYDIRVAFFPASDSLIPFALIAAVLEFNDQNRHLPADRKFNNPGWGDLNAASQLGEPENRDRLFDRAEQTVFEDAAFFPLYRPYVYAVAGDKLANMGFDFYGFPRIAGIVKFTAGDTAEDN